MDFLRFMGRNARWLAGGFLLCFFSSFGQTFYISLSNGDIRREFDLSNGAFGVVYMIATLASAATLPLLGWLLDRFKAWQVGCATVLSLALATALMAVAGNLPLLFLSLYLLRLFGQGMMTETAMTATGRWFAANRGRAMSIISLGFHLGTGLFPLIFVSVAAALGWRGTWLACGAVLVVLALPVIVYTTHKDRDPQSEPKSRAKPDVRDWTLKEVLAAPSFWLIASAVLAPPFIVTTLFFHQVYLTNLRGWSLEVFASGFAVMSATTLVFALIAGGLIDRFSAVRLLPVFLVPMALACFVVWQFSAEASIFVFMVCLGVSNGFSSTLQGAILPELYGIKHLGSLRSALVAMMVLSSALGPGVTGLLIDQQVDYPLQIGVMGLYCVAISVVMLVVSRRQVAAAVEAEASLPLSPQQAIDRIDPQPGER
ncbi:MFS transporter [Jiella sp. MQZ9-1]|uniref:MFS transporter n=1 Tax=Jiella flava TaxID=2816857 RepID=A0A939FWU2_9HYPH|nr:MFS transporter [Jiella flava]MBO0661498.1 MFS transporter [Jiella flava]MCD2470140.1 MFS transporter [Jiella flava]